SAQKYRDRPIGLTVRDLTYEVRQALKMSPDAPGVVVSKIEEGTPAAVAKISEGELITRIDSDEIASVDDFEAKITAAREAELDTVKVEILRLGKTRVADLSLSK
ncbi:MAG: PDZ domain-containing protein, partial [Phycisphaerae bacterium]|nr:PDZ domain-containing protein [Phycisphaerae bacterium]